MQRAWCRGGRAGGSRSSAPAGCCRCRGVGGDGPDEAAHRHKDTGHARWGSQSPRSTRHAARARGDRTRVAGYPPIRPRPVHTTPLRSLLWPWPRCPARDDRGGSSCADSSPVRASIPASRLLEAADHSAVSFRSHAARHAAVADRNHGTVPNGMVTGVPPPVLSAGLAETVTGPSGVPDCR